MPSSTTSTNSLEEIPHVNLLLVEKMVKYHSTYVRDLNHLLYEPSKKEHRKYFCERRLHGSSREDLLEKHKPECKGIGGTAVRVEMPEEGVLTFQNSHKRLPAPYVIYADFEALTTKIAVSALDLTKSNTTKSQMLEDCSYCYIVMRCGGEAKPPVEYRGPNAAELVLQEEERKIRDVLASPKAM